MPLQEYRQKRRFSGTPEPRGRAGRTGGALRFVIQEHHATRRHWDFRLEMGGTLKSWAVPKGPTLDPDEKRLAVPVEDHPIEYMEFEGVIPTGNYGAGPVMVWDRGTYEMVDGAPLEGYEKGKLTIVLHGKKLRGEFHLVRTRLGGQTQWLMFKKRDKDAVPGWTLLEPSVSVKTGCTIEQIKNEAAAQWKPKTGNEGTRERGNATQKVLRSLGLAKPGRDPFPREIKPMLATLVDEPFDDPQMLFEIKWDGIRAIAYVRRRGAERQVTIRSRGGHIINEQYPEIVAALYALEMPDAVLDGEIVALDPQGRSQFQLLQQWMHIKGGTGPAKQAPIAYYVFDLLFTNGHLLTDRPLVGRRKALEAVLPQHPLVRISEAVLGDGRTFYKAAQDLGVEGIVGKRKTSAYLPGRRTNDWVKIKVKQRLEAVVGGYTRGQGARAKTFGALLLGAYDRRGTLHYIGHCGGGFTDTELARVSALLRERADATCPFAEVPVANEQPTWVRPELVAEVEYGGWTADQLLRFPVYKGLRDDKRPREVIPERPQLRARRDLDVGVEFTNLDKVFWPDRGYTKGDLIHYYLAISKFILPHLRDRPITLRRFPNGIAGESFYQKDSPDAPPFVHLVRVWTDSSKETLAAPVCNNLPTLLWLAQLADIEIHTWFSRITPLRRAERAGTASTDFAGSDVALRGSVLNRPDFVVFDIDPYLFPGGKLPQRKGEKDPDYSRRGFDAATEAAFMVRGVLKELRLEGFVKTSGKTGLHIFVPIARRYTFEQTHEFAKTVTGYLEGRYPKKVTTAWAAEKRVGKVFLDYNQNRLGATLASAYSVRPTPEATVSAPLTWKELERGLDPLQLTLESVPDFMKRRTDPWKNILSNPQRLEEHIRD